MERESNRAPRARAADVLLKLLETGQVTRFDFVGTDAPELEFDLELGGRIYAYRIDTWEQGFTEELIDGATLLGSVPNRDSVAAIGRDQDSVATESWFRFVSLVSRLIRYEGIALVSSDEFRLMVRKWGELPTYAPLNRPQTWYRTWC